MNWVLHNKFGDRGKADFDINDREWSTVNVDNCSFEKCYHRRECHFYNMRTQISDIGSQDVIIINQDLLVADLIRKQKELPPLLTTRAPLIIIDEAHNLESKVRNALTNVWSLKSLRRLAKNLDNQFSTTPTYNENRKYLAAFELQIEALFKVLFKQIKDKKIDPSFMQSERFAIDFPLEIDYQQWKKIINKFSVALTSLQARHNGFKSRTIDELAEQLDQMWKLMKDIEKGIVSPILLWTTCENDVVELYSCPKEIQNLLKEILFKTSEPVVLTSATLCQPAEKIKDQYQYIVKSLGFPGIVTEPKYADYDYNHNSRLYVANDIPEPSHQKGDEYYQLVADRILMLSNMTDGRSIVLFTAKDDLNRVHQIMSARSLAFPLYTQQDGSSQSTVLQRFRRNHGVLLGTGVFWEGVDIKGDDLSQVIIVRLPFPVPDPIIDYKASLSVNPHKEVLLPEMLIKLRQGVGRLIRMENDKGVLSILDSRLSTASNKSYKDLVFRSLPIQNRTESLDE
ncbi:ATP-dependent DNA helicase [Paenibacillus sp. NPDC057967]|uniref:ATP-dependent DNA helicase n=1 Tax=Paenibacillus sp. NPDC057967 TaxID=3346293 RepID=UPI0036DBBD00